MNDYSELVQLAAEELLKRLQVDGIVKVKKIEETLVIDVETGDAALLIGTRGETLEALQHLMRVLSQKAAGEFVSVTVDIEGYRQRRAEMIESMVAQVAARVRETGKAEVLKPMNSSERRIVHIKVKEMTGVMSESAGEGEERQVVIKPFMKSFE